jgi:1-aminocyclopropane-1-carboxylate deaminase
LLINNSNITFDALHNELLQSKDVTLSVLRLDKIHPVISGNKLFKLHYFLEQAQQNNIQKVVTFGGAFSNHLVATAYACNLHHLQSAGIVRGEMPAELSHTLSDCIQYGMQLKFISRQEYNNKDTEDFIDLIKNEFGESIIIPEGGYHFLGAKGAGLIMTYIQDSITHICCACGTATTMAGLLTNKKDHQQIIGIPVLKGMTDIEERIQFLTGKKVNKQVHIESGYHFGGYAKKNSTLITFMNDVYSEFQLPTDFVYSAKMLYGIFDMINKNYFPKGSQIVCIHTGGLQGNLSLPETALTF